MQQIADWLQTIGLGQYTELFAGSDIDLTVLHDLTDQDLENIGISLGHRKKILRAIAAVDKAGFSPYSARRTGAERRQPTRTTAVPYTTLSLSPRVHPAAREPTRSL